MEKKRTDQKVKERYNGNRNLRIRMKTAEHGDTDIEENRECAGYRADDSTKRHSPTGSRGAL